MLTQGFQKPDYEIESIGMDGGGYSAGTYFYILEAKGADAKEVSKKQADTIDKACNRND